MSKEWLRKTAQEFIVRSIIMGKNHGLKPEGKPHFDKFVNDFVNGRQIVLSRYIHMLDGYDYESNIHGLENLEQFKGQPILVVTDHLTEDPIRGGHGQRVVINHYVNLVTQKEIRWFHGRDKTTLQDLVRNDLAKQSNTILVRDDDPKASLALIRQAFSNKDTIGLNPEGDGNKTLHQGVAKAGKMIIASALRNYNSVCVATYFKNGAFFLTVEPPLNNERILEARRILKGDKEKSQQLQGMISDYAMARIARHLPKEKQGHYSNFQKFIDAFESLTA